jgi:hypothetical protein
MKWATTSAWIIVKKINASCPIEIQNYFFLIVVEMIIVRNAREILKANTTTPFTKEIPFLNTARSGLKACRLQRRCA